MAYPYRVPYAYAYNTSAETVDTGGFFSLPFVNVSREFKGCCTRGVVIKNPGLYRVDVRVEAEADLGGGFSVNVQLNGTTAPAGIMSVTTGTQI